MRSKAWTRRRFLLAVPAAAAAACTASVTGVLGPPDGGSDGGSDAGDGDLDAGGFDAGPRDAGPLDAGSDAGADAGAETQVCAANFPRLDLKADCLAVGDGQTNDTQAFRTAAQKIQQAGGGELTIPPGVYIVGNQTPKQRSTDPGPYYKDDDIFTVNGVACLKVSGYGATLRVKAGLHYGGFNPSSGAPQDYTSGTDNEAKVGRILNINRCSNVVVEGLEIDGSNESLILGGQWGNVDRQAAATGVLFNECDNVSVIDVHTHHHGLDGIAVEYQNGAPPRRMPHTLTRVTSEYNGRQGISWIGGWGLTCIDCKFNHTGRAMNAGAPMKSRPSDGIDIEPNAGTTQKSREGLFTRCEFINNAGNGVESAAGDGGYSTFDDCTIWGTTRYSIWVTNPGVKFTNCRIYGTVVHGCDGHTASSPSPNPALATQFEGCTFEDLPWTDGSVYRNGALYNLSEGGDGMSWKDCTFITHQVRAVDIGNAATTERFEGCTFIHGYTGLASGSFQSRFTGCALKSCHFEESSAVAAGSSHYDIALNTVTVAAPSAGAPATHVDGPKVKWGSTTGPTGDIAPGSYG